jgi:NTE family protein
VPFIFEPVQVSGATWVDGGLLSNFPVQLFDSTDDRPRWPTFGIRLSARPGKPPTHRIRGPLSLAFGALETLISDQDAAYIDDPCTVRRTIFVPAESVGTLDFDITAPGARRARQPRAACRTTVLGVLGLPRIPAGVAAAS